MATANPAMRTPHDYLAEIGRRGGIAKGKPKGFAAMTPEERRRISAKAVAARRKARRAKSA